LTLHLLGSDRYVFSTEDRRTIDDIAVATEQQLRALLPLVEASEDVLPTGDNALTVAPHLVRWKADPALCIAGVAHRHLAQALAHKAFHAARSRQLPPKVDGVSWEHVGIAEGLATGFARDNFDAHEPWSAYSANLVESWAAGLFAQPLDEQSVLEWKFNHPDGRTFIAFCVGTWLVDLACPSRAGTPGTSSGARARDPERGKAIRRFPVLRQALATVFPANEVPANEAWPLASVQVPELVDTVASYVAKRDLARHEYSAITRFFFQAWDLWLRRP
jgi:hypothetical protein